MTSRTHWISLNQATNASAWEQRLELTIDWTCQAATLPISPMITKQLAVVLQRGTHNRTQNSLAVTRNQIGY